MGLHMENSLPAVVPEGIVECYQILIPSTNTSTFELGRTRGQTVRVN